MLQTNVEHLEHIGRARHFEVKVSDLLDLGPVAVFDAVRANEFHQRHLLLLRNFHLLLQLLARSLGCRTAVALFLELFDHLCERCTKLDALALSILSIDVSERRLLPHVDLLDPLLGDAPQFLERLECLRDLVELRLIVRDGHLQQLLLLRNVIDFELRCVK